MSQAKRSKKRQAAAAIITVLSAASLFVLINTAGASRQYYPEGYRSWFHVKSMVIEEGHPLASLIGGVVHEYANKKALEGYKMGKFPDGSVIVLDVLEAKKGDKILTEGERKLLVYMKKNSKLTETGGWEWGAYAGGDRTKQVVTDPVGQCFSCHQQAKDTDYVFGKIRK